MRYLREVVVDARTSVEPTPEHLEGRKASADGYGSAMRNDVVLLTDGRSNPEPPEVAVAGAAGAKARGILIFTIGLGDDTDADALRAIASRPSYYYHAPAADDLAHIHGEVAKQIACPEPLR